MTTTDMHAASSPAPRTERRLRRSSTNRVGAGVAAGLGDYFAVDPVLFRVLFATAAFFGGAGILAYLLAWAVIPEDGTEHAPIDGWVAALRRHRVPPWLVITGGVVALWVIAFSWWAPGPFLPVVAIVVVLVVVFGRREWQRSSAAGTAAGTGATVDLTKSPDTGTPDASPYWVRDGRAWLSQARTAHRERRRRALPVKITTLVTLGAALVVLAVVDSITGIELQWYFWVSLAIVVLGLLIGAALRRGPWTVATLLPVIVAGCLAFGGTPTRVGDGIGDRQWRPTTVPAAQYHLAFGRGTLDLRSLPAQPTPRTIDVRVGAGQLKLLMPKTLNATVHAYVHVGQLDIDGRSTESGGGGVGFNRAIDPPAGAPGALVTIDVHLADGQVTVANQN